MNDTLNINLRNISLQNHVEKQNQKFLTHDGDIVISHFFSRK